MYFTLFSIQICLSAYCSHDLSPFYQHPTMCRPCAFCRPMSCPPVLARAKSRASCAYFLSSHKFNISAQLITLIVSLDSIACSPATASTSRLSSLPPTPFPPSMSSVLFFLCPHSHDVPRPCFSFVFSWWCISHLLHQTFSLNSLVSHWCICVSWPMCSAAMHSIMFTLKLWYRSTCPPLLAPSPVSHHTVAPNGP